MIPITVYVPENQVDFFSGLVKKLDYTKEIGEIPDFQGEIPDFQKAIIDQRLAEYEKSPNDILSWDEVKHTFKMR